MNTKSKGSNAERELIHAFWEHGFAAVRAAGSGSMKYPSPDVFALKGNRRIAIECKATKNQYKYFEKREIEELEKFSHMSRAEAYVAVKFKGHPWYFLQTVQLVEKDKSFLVDLVRAQERGISFEKLVE